MPWTTCSAWRAMNVCGPGSKERCKRRRGYMRRPGSRRGCLPSFSIRRTRVGAGAAGWWPRPSRLRAKRTRASSSPQSWAAAALYEQLYCARGDMENRIKEQFSLFSDRLSTATMRANQFRLYLSSLAYVLLQALRRLGLRGTELAHAQASTLRLKLLKVGAQIRVTVRRVWVAMATSYAHRRLFETVYQQLRC